MTDIFKHTKQASNLAHTVTGTSERRSSSNAIKGGLWIVTRNFGKTVGTTQIRNDLLSYSRKFHNLTFGFRLHESWVSSVSVYSSILRWVSSQEYNSDRLDCPETTYWVNVLIFGRVTCKMSFSGFMRHTKKESSKIKFYLKLQRFQVQWIRFE